MNNGLGIEIPVIAPSSLTPRELSLPVLQIEQEIDIKNRIIYLTDIDLLASSFIKQRAETIYELSKDDKTDLNLVISSYGGDAYGMFGVIDVMQGLPTKVNTVGVGTVQSAATVILGCGTGTRAVTKNTFIMIHQISTWLERGQTDSLANEIKHTKELQVLLYKVMGETTRKPSKFWESQTKKNLYLTAEKCLEYGLVDSII